jgi:hypothetical protein
MRSDDSSPATRYIRFTARGHPLADLSGRVLLHRWVVYRRVGSGAHPCFWCGRMLVWGARRGSPDAIVVDHLDSDRQNNADANLVVACHGCNVGRRYDPIRRDNPAVMVAVTRTCVECGKPFLTRGDHADVQRHCSRRCQLVAGARARRVPLDEPHVVQRRADGTIKARVRAVSLICEHCGASFLVEHARLKKGTARFCSYACTGKTIGGHATRRRGADNHHASLTEAAVREMRRLWAAGGISLEALGARFGVTKSGANMVVYRRSWKHVV